jgi:transcriptional regulator with XRE-family HTH domain
MLNDRPSFRARWEETKPKRDIAVSLARLRASAGLTQTKLAELTGWDKAFVSRLESAAGPVPDIATLSKYGEACGAAVGIVFATLEPTHLHVVGSVTLSSAGDYDPFEQLRDVEFTSATIAEKLGIT